MGAVKKGGADYNAQRVILDAVARRERVIVRPLGA